MVTGLLVAGAFTAGVSLARVGDAAEQIEARLFAGQVTAKSSGDLRVVGRRGERDDETGQRVDLTALTAQAYADVVYGVGVPVVDPHASLRKELKRTKAHVEFLKSFLGHVDGVHRDDDDPLPAA